MTVCVYDWPFANHFLFREGPTLTQAPPFPRSSWITRETTMPSKPSEERKEGNETPPICPFACLLVCLKPKKISSRWM